MEAEEQIRRIKNALERLNNHIYLTDVLSTQNLLRETFVQEVRAILADPDRACKCPAVNFECPHCGRQFPPDNVQNHKDRCHKAAVAARSSG